MSARNPTDAEAITFWTITCNPSDCPGKYVVRPHYVGVEGSTVGCATVAYTLQGARDAIPPGCHRFPRGPYDDPVIVECWMK